MKPKLLTAALVAAIAVALAGIPRATGGGRPALATLQTETPTLTSTPATPTLTATASATLTATASPTPTSTPVPVTAPAINFPESQCNGPFPYTSATVTFTWTPGSGSVNQYLDLSLFDNSFADGTYISTGALEPSTTRVIWNGIRPGLAHFWRVTAFAASGWVMSAFGTFTPCGTQQLLNVSYVCTGGGRATVTFRWAPASSPGFFQWVDLSLFNNNFAAGTFLGSGSWDARLQALIWPGILANNVHFWRVNTFTVSGWSPSATGVFVAQC